VQVQVVPGKAKAPSRLVCPAPAVEPFFGSDRPTRVMFEMLKRIISKILDGIEFAIHVCSFVGGAPSKFSAERPNVPDWVRVPEYPDNRD
jgi:hypothetical protein